MTGQHLRKELEVTTPVLYGGGHMSVLGGSLSEPGECLWSCEAAWMTRDNVDV